MAARIRNASHAGSWYHSNGEVLASQFDNWLNHATIPDSTNGKNVRAIIAPHAGYTYCGATSAHAYKHINTDGIETVFVLGPAHHLYISGLALSRASQCKTPIGDLRVSEQTNKEIEREAKQRGLSVERLRHMEDEEDEHSLEMHMPWIAHCFDRSRISIVPIIVGQIDSDAAAAFGSIFSRYLTDPTCFFVISSDFCHWGKRFKYTYLEETSLAIHEAIRALDNKGMEAIRSLNPVMYHSYQKTTKNTICGRNPISILLHAVSILHLDAESGATFQMEFVHYSQSSQCKTASDSSVSYAAGVLFAATGVSASRSAVTVDSTIVSSSVA